MKQKFFKSTGVSDDELHAWLETNGVGDIITSRVHQFLCIEVENQVKVLIADHLRCVMISSLGGIPNNTIQVCRYKGRLMSCYRPWQMSSGLFNAPYGRLTDGLDYAIKGIRSYQTGFEAPVV